MKKEQFNTPWDSDYWMESNGFFCGFNMPEALEGEEIHGLPPYEWRSSFLVDEYPACPSDWMLSEGKLTSYFVPIQDGKGMWLDFNKNGDKKYHVAIVVSIQGVNAITGLPCNDVQLEQYTEKCPKHDKPFGPNRYCEECGFKWPKQNYLCTTGTPNGNLWLDGFRAANGAVQQYILTEKTMRGVASNILGSKRVYAIGISFFLSKNPKPVVEHRTSYRSMSTKGSSNTLLYAKKCCNPSAPVDNYETDVDWNNYTLDYNNNDTFEMKSSFNHTTTDNITDSDARGIICTSATASPLREAKSFTTIRTKNMEIGAGASIKQQVYEDPEPLDYWRDKPESILCINYCLEDEAIKIIKQGKVSKDGHPQGFLKDVPVGN